MKLNITFRFQSFTVYMPHSIKLCQPLVSNYSTIILYHLLINVKCGIFIRKVASNTIRNLVLKVTTLCVVPVEWST